MLGNQGGDWIFGDHGHDELFAGVDGENYVDDQHTVNYLNGGRGNDLLVGEYGRDWMFGDDYQIREHNHGYRYIDWDFGGNDRLYGRKGSDILFGGPGHDDLFGGYHDDYLFGGPDHDNLDGGPGHDYKYQDSEPRF